MNAIPAWRPGDDKPDTEAMIRVDQAGEYGATRIYAGQLAVLGDRHPASRAIARLDKTRTAAAGEPKKTGTR